MPLGTTSGQLYRPGDAQFRPRVILGISGAWESLPPPRSFAIRHELDSAFGIVQTAGLGFERMNDARTARWGVDVRLAQCWFEHDHTMLDTRTNELAEEQINVHRWNFMLVFGVGWF